MFNYFDCTTVLIDTSSDPTDLAMVESEIEQADVILLMYDMSRSETADKVGIYWMPRIKKINDKIPVIIVANKLDLQNQEDYELQKIFKVIKPLIKHFN